MKPRTLTNAENLCTFMQCVDCIESTKDRWSGTWVKSMNRNVLKYTVL